MIVVHHNPRCSKSREAVALLEEAGHEPVLIDYLKEGWTRPQLLGLFAAAGLTPRDALRAKEARAAGLGADAADEDVIDAMIATPALVERPLVCGPGGVAVCRPPEKALALASAREGAGHSEGVIG